jgi:cytochrome P450
MRPFWLLSRYSDISAVERRGAPFTAAPRTFLTSKMTEDRLERMLGKPYVIRGLLQMDEPEHTAYRAVAQPWLTRAALAEMEPGWKTGPTRS